MKPEAVTYAIRDYVRAELAMERIVNGVDEDQSTANTLTTTKSAGRNWKGCGGANSRLYRKRRKASDSVLR